MEVVNDFETAFTWDYRAIAVVAGGLIQAAGGSASGCGCLAKRSGLRRQAASRTSARCSRTLAATAVLLGTRAQNLIASGSPTTALTLGVDQRIAFTFDKTTGVQFVKTLAEGGPIRHEGPWTADEMLTLAGACYFAVFSQGPTMDKVAVHLVKKVPERHPEHAEAREQEFNADIHGAIEFLSTLAMRAYGGDYYEHFEPVLQALLNLTDHSVASLRGFKARPDGAKFDPDSSA